MVGRYDFPGISYAQNVALHLIFTWKASMSRKGIHLLLPGGMSQIREWDSVLKKTLTQL